MARDTREGKQSRTREDRFRGPREADVEGDREEDLDEETTAWSGGDDEEIEAPEESRQKRGLETGDMEDPRSFLPGDESSEEIGGSASRRRSAPPSSGLPHGSSGVIDREQDVDDAGEKRPGEAGQGETPVPSPTGGADAGGHVQSGSSGAASESAGSAPPQTAGEGSEDREVIGGQGDERHGGRVSDKEG